MNTINAASSRIEPAFRSWVDTPASNELGSRHVVVRGWCYSRSHQPVTAVRARVGSQTFAGIYGDPRPDVFKAFGGEPASDSSGYEIAVTFPSGSATCDLEAQIRGQWQPFQSFQVTAAPVQPWRDRFIWTRFWLNAWLGRPQAWSALSADDRDFLVAWARHRGWLNLQLIPQHAPRPVSPERFPRPRDSAEKLPRITVVTPSYQQASFLEATIRSVTEQANVRIDYIVQDGGSNDGSVDIIRRYATRLKHWESRKDHGQADAIVRGFAHLECGPDDLMMYLNSDDMLMPGAAHFVARYFARHPEVDVVYGHRVLIDEAGMEVGRWYSPRRACDDLRMHDLIPQETLFWRRRVWDRVGGIDPSFHFALDWDLVLRFAAIGARFARVPWFLGMFRLHSLQKSQAQLEQRGIPEMERLRLRTLGRQPTTEEMHFSMRRAQLDSALLFALGRHGIRA